MHWNEDRLDEKHLFSNSNRQSIQVYVSEEKNRRRRGNSQLTPNLVAGIERPNLDQNQSNSSRSSERIPQPRTSLVTVGRVLGNQISAHRHRR